MARATTKGEHVRHLRGHNSEIMTWVKILFPLSMYAKCMSELCSKFQIPASNTVGIAEIQTVPQCDMVKICISFRGK